MKGATMVATMQRLGVIKSYSRPATSNDNPFSEALFKTVKYCSKYPKRPFESLAQAVAWMGSFVVWYNNEHRHSGIKFVTPHQRHTGQDKEILVNRTNVYKKARSQNPGRWARDIRNWDHVQEVYINPIPVGAG